MPRFRIDRDRIDRIKNGAILINTARGLVADYDAMENAIKTGKLSALGLDVFPEEPLGHHPICGYGNVLCTPHSAFKTKEALDQLNEEVIENVLKAQVLRGS
jgi:D-3-phosphoglycerate dehydrogenase / 2-oxoglutarate reductase